MCKQSAVKLDTAMLNELNSYIDNLESLEGELITILHKAQDIFGYLPKELQIYIARKLSIPIAEVLGVVSFYSYFLMKPKGKYHISVCTGTACYVKGADKVLDRFAKELNIEPGGTTQDGMFSLDSLRCVGACALAPVVLIGDDVKGKFDVEDVRKLIDELENE